MNSFTQRVLETIRNIPTGKVMTYGQIAQLSGSPRGARQVVRILHSMSGKYQLPWHRVINAKGALSFKDDEQFMVQQLRLQMEGVEFSQDGRISLAVFQHHPDDTFQRNL